jgi:hypothetical protein
MPGAIHLGFWPRVAAARVARGPDEGGAVALEPEAEVASVAATPCVTAYAREGRAGNVVEDMHVVRAQDGEGDVKPGDTATTCTGSPGDTLESRHRR